MLLSEYKVFPFRIVLFVLISPDFLVLIPSHLLPYLLRQYFAACDTYLQVVVLFVHLDKGLKQGHQGSAPP